MVSILPCHGRGEVSNTSGAAIVIIAVRVNAWKPNKILLTRLGEPVLVKGKNRKLKNSNLTDKKWRVIVGENPTCYLGN